jgi:hypothetical protein
MVSLLLLLACAPIDPKADVLVVSGTLDGKPVRVFVDTGGSGAVSPALAKRLKAIPGQKARFAGASGAWRESKIYEIGGLRIGEVAIAPFHAIASPVHQGVKYDLMIGLPELKSFVLDIDLAKNQFCLSQDAPTVATAPYQRKADGVIVVPAKLGARQFEHFIFDTGAGVTTMTERFLGEVAHRKRPEHVISVDGSGVRRKQFFVEVDEICAFGRCKPKQTVMPDQDLSELNGFPVDGILGMSFLKGSRITLDLPRGRIAIDG